MKHYGFGSRILAWVCVVVMLVMMIPLSGFTAVEEEIVEESPVYEAPVVLAALDGLAATYTITVDSAISGGTVSVDPAEAEAEAGDVIAVTATPGNGYELQEITVDGSKIEGNTFEMPAANVTVSATFVRVYTIGISKDIPNGEVSVDDNQVVAGEDVTINVSAASGYKLDTLMVSDADDNPVTLTGTTFTMPASDVSIQAAFVQKDYSITKNFTGEGTLTVVSHADAGETVSVSANPSAGYKLSSLTWKATSGADNDIVESKQFSMPNEAVEVTAVFVKESYAVSVVATENGTVTVADSATTAEFDFDVKFTATPNSGYKIGSVQVNGGDVTVTGENGVFTFKMPAEVAEIEVTFTEETYAITLPENLTGGTIAVAEEAKYNSTVTFAVTPAEDYNLTADSVKMNDSVLSGTAGAGETMNYSFTMPAGEVKLEAGFEEEAHDILIMEGNANGTVTCAVAHADAGETVTFTAVPNSYYELKENALQVNGGAVELTAGEGNSYSFTMPEESATITASFTAIEYTVTMVLDSVYVSSIVREGDATNTDIKSDLGYNESVSDQRYNSRDKLIGATYTCTFTATCEDALIVTFAKMAIDKGQVSYPTALYVAGETLSTYKVVGGAAKLTAKINEILPDTTITSTKDSSGENSTKIDWFVTYKYSASELNITEKATVENEGTLIIKNITAKDGYTLQDAISVVYTDSDTDEVEHTWEIDKNNTATLTVSNVTDSITVFIDCTFNDDNYVVAPAAPNGDGWYTEYVTITPKYDGVQISQTGESGSWADSIELKDGDFSDLVIYTKHGDNEERKSHPILVDTIAPVVEVIKYTESIYRETGNRYVDDAVTITYQVTEKNFDKVRFENGFSGLPSSGVTIGEWSSNGDKHTITVTLTADQANDGVYNAIELTGTDKAGNDGEVTADPIVLDNTAPNVYISNIEYAAEDISIWDKILLSIKYHIAASDYAEVTVTAEDVNALSPIQEITLTDTNNTVFAVKTPAPEYGKDATVSATFIVNAQYMDQLTATATDAAGNTKTVAPDVDNSGDSNNTNNTNILLDTVAPEISALTFPGAIPSNEDIEFTFTVTDPDDGEGDYSGIGEVTYAVYVDKDQKAGGVLYSHANGEHYQELNSNTETYPMSFTLPASYNSNNVYVVINAKDNAGNPAKEMESKTFRLDETAPDVSVVFEGTPGAYGYFKDRKATVTVKDHSFIEDGVVMDTNGNIGNWSGVDTDNDDYEDVWTCIVDFNSVDGEYHFGIAVTDEAGNKTIDDEVTYTYEEGQENTKAFVVDDTAPVLSVGDYVVTNLANTIGNELMDGVYYTNDSIRLTFTVDDQFFYVEDGSKVHGATDGFGSFHITLLKNGVVMEDITNHGVWDIDGTGRKCTVELKYNEAFNADTLTEGDYTLKLSVVDQAGNVSDSNEMEDGAQPRESSVMVLDQTKPNVYISDIAYGDDLTVFEKYLFSIKYQIAASDIAKVTIRAEDANSPIIGMTLADANRERTANEEELETSKDEAGKFTGYQVYIIDAQYMDQLTLTATDASGNTGTCEHDTANAGDTNILLDTVDPTITFNNPDYETVHSGYVNGQYVDGYTYPVSLTVTDPTVDDVFSGLDTVYYEVRVYNHTSKSSYSVSSSDTFTVYTDGNSYTNTGTFTVNLAPSLNSNIVTVYIKATDNAGNYAEAETNFFKLDNTTPSVTVDYDNDSAQNDTYFMDTRTATITVVDNNFTADGVSITTEGSVGEWSSGSDSNGDGVLDTYVCYVSYTVDNDYTISMSVVDEGSNTTFNSFVNYTGTAPEEFTLDQTDPTFEITMGNADVDVSSGGYSNQDVTVTLTVDEHNFDESAATSGLSVIYEGEDISQAIRSSLVWSSNGDVRTATFTLTDDGEYKINLSFLDLAGNSTAAAEDIVVRVDQTNAEVYVTGVADKSANAQDEIIPVVTIWDKYYNLEGVVITLINGEGKDVTEQYLDMETGLSDIAYDEERDLYYQTFTFKNLDEDHVYHLEVRHTDLAGNVNTAMTVLNGKGEEEVLDLEEGVMRFSVNRNGSTYSASEETLAILGQYVQSAKDVRILEINVDELDPESIYITLTHDNVTRDLVYGEDYTYQTPPEQNDASWNVYEYALEDSLFEEDGVYTITIYSVDAAGNVAQNNTAEKDFEITFVVDKTPPIFVALNLEAGEIYNEEQHEVTINCSDNIALDTVHVYRLDRTAEKDEDGNYIWFREKANGEIEMLCEEVELTAVEGSNGDYAFVLYEGDSAATSKQSILVVCTDKAGNQNLEQEILGFTVSSSFWIRFYANKPLFYGSIGGISALLIVAAIVFLRKKKEEN